MLLKENITGQKACYKTKLTYRKGCKNLFFKFVATSPQLYSFSDKYNSELYRGDVCEIFIKYGKENHYYEIEVAPNGAIFLADIENDGTGFKGELLSDCFISATSKINKKGYVVKIKIPRSYIKTDKIKFNAFRIDTEGGNENRHLFALHPTLCATFHVKKYIY